MKRKIDKGDIIAGALLLLAGFVIIAAINNIG